MILLDTNGLTRMTRSHDAQSGVARAAIQTLIGRDERLIVVPQNLYEKTCTSSGRWRPGRVEHRPLDATASE